MSDQATIEALQKECQRIAAERDLAQQTCAELQAKLDQRFTILKQQRAARIALVATVAGQVFRPNEYSNFPERDAVRIAQTIVNTTEELE